MKQRPAWALSYVHITARTRGHALQEIEVQRSYSFVLALSERADGAVDLLSFTSLHALSCSEGFSRHLAPCVCQEI